METSSPGGLQGDADARRVVLIYAVIALLWLFLSDHLLAFLVSDPARHLQFGFLKGVAFVLVTSALLYWLIRRQLDRALAAERVETAHERERTRVMRLLQAMADSSDAGLYAKDLEGRYLFVNRAAVAMMGRPAEEIVGRDAHALFPAPQAAIMDEVGRQALAYDREITGVETVELPGGPRTLYVSRGALRDADGTVIGHYGFARDVTDQQAAALEAQRLAEDLAATLKAIPDLLFELDAEGRYVRVATTAHELLAAPESHIIGRTVHEVLPPEAARTVMDGIASATRTGSDYGRTIGLELEGGKHHFEMSFARKSTTGAGPAHFIVLSRDITRRVQADAELMRINDDLRRFDDAAVNRELRMIELKREVNALAVELGRAPPYDLAFAADGEPATP